MLTGQPAKVCASAHRARTKAEFAACGPPKKYHAPMKSEAADDKDERDQLSQNIEAIVEFYTQEELKISRSQRVLERISEFIGQPVFLGFILVFVALWMLANTAMLEFGKREFDPAPYHWLQGIIALGGLLTATVVLIKQNRLAGLAEQRAHLDLKVTLLTEQKAAKMIALLEELRRDLPNVRNRHDAEAVALREPMNPELVRAALDEGGELAEGAASGAGVPAPLIITAGKYPAATPRPGDAVARGGPA